MLNDIYSKKQGIGKYAFSPCKRYCLTRDCDERLLKPVLWQQEGNSELYTRKKDPTACPLPFRPPV